MAPENIICGTAIQFSALSLDITTIFHRALAWLDFLHVVDNSLQLLVSDLVNFVSNPGPTINYLSTVSGKLTYILCSSHVPSKLLM